MYAGLMEKDTGMVTGSHALEWATVTNNIPSHYIVLLQPTQAGGGTGEQSIISNRIIKH